MCSPSYLPFGSPLQLQCVLQHKLRRELDAADSRVKTAPLQGRLALFMVIWACRRARTSGISQRMITQRQTEELHAAAGAR